LQVALTTQFDAFYGLLIYPAVLLQPHELLLTIYI